MPEILNEPVKTSRKCYQYFLSQGKSKRCKQTRNLPLPHEYKRIYVSVGKKIHTANSVRFSFLFKNERPFLNIVFFFKI